MESSEEKSKKITYKLAKLVRDKHELEMKKDKMVTGKTKTLDFSSHVLALKEKLVEEAKEVLEAPSKENLILELADLKEVYVTLQDLLGVPSEEIEKARQQIFEKRGGFKRGFYIDYITLPTGHRIAKTLSKQPDKYPVLSNVP